MASHSTTSSFILLSSCLQLTQAAFAGRHAMITGAPNALGKRQVQCAAEANTICPQDNGCCPPDSPCTFNAASIAICGTPCASPAALCAGQFSELCCNSGSTCDGTGLCAATATDNLFPMPTFTNDITTEIVPSDLENFPSISNDLTGEVPNPTTVISFISSSTPTGSLEIMPSITDIFTPSSGLPTSTPGSEEPTPTSSDGEESQSQSAPPPSDTGAAVPLATSLNGGVVKLVVGGLAGLFAFGLV